MDKSNQKCRVAPLHDNHSDVQLIAGCGVGGIKAARLATGLETGTGEPEFCISFLAIAISMERTSEQSNP
jgi:hypothetical protein